MDVHSGTVTLKIVAGIFKTKLLPNCFCVLYPAKSTFPPRLDIYESQGKTEVKKSIDIVDARWQKKDALEPSFCFSVKSKQYVFVFATQEECKFWYQFLCCLSVDLLTSHKEGEGGVMGNDNAVVMQDNCLYSSSIDVALFDVVADKNSCCARFGFKGLMKLCFDPQNIKLYEMNGVHTVAEWTYYSVRSFGHSKHTLNITVGKSSSTGHGNFSFLTVEGNAMVELITFYTKRLKEQERTAHTPSPVVGTMSAVGLRETKQSSDFSSTPSKKKPTPSVPSPKPSIPSPKPVTPSSGHSPAPMSSNAFDIQFKRDLELKFGAASSQGDGKQPLEKKTSNSSVASGSIGRKGIKEKKNAKQMEKEDKKLAKEREKMERERQKQMEKHKKNEGKGKDKPHIPEKSYPKENEYAEPYGTQQNEMDGDYAECNFDSRNGPSTERKVESKVYNEPWGALPIQMFHSDHVNNSDPDYAETDDVYAHPVKSGRNPFATRIEEESYEDVGFDGPSPDIPSKCDADRDDDNLNNNVYDHFVVDRPEDHPENVYGMESGKLLTNNIKSKKAPPIPSVESDIYSTVD